MAARRPGSRRLTPAQTLVLAFGAAIAVGTLLLSLPVAHAPGRPISFLDAFFTATSAVCVTGLVVVDTGGAFSRFGETVIMLLIKAGGLGILSLGVLVALATGRRLGFRERQNLQVQTGRTGTGGVVRFTKHLLVITVSIELVGAAVLYATFRRVEGPLEGAFYALFHSVSALNNAGFALYADSLVRFAGEPIVSLTVAILFIVGGLGMPVLIDVVSRYRERRRRQLRLNTKTGLFMTSLLLVGSMLAILGMEWANPDTLGALPPAERVLAGFFQAATPRTAGFNTLDFAAMNTGTLVLVIFLMFVGGNPGGTAGGIRTTTLAILAGSAAAYARGKHRLVLFGRTITHDLVMKAGVIATIGVFLCGSALLILTFTEPEADFLSLAFETVSAMGTVGLSLGATAGLSSAGKLVLIALMFAGRIGLLTFALALAERPEPERAEYPREDLIVG